MGEISGHIYIYRGGGDFTVQYSKEDFRANV